MMKITVLLSITVFILFLQSAAGADNLIPNPGFETGGLMPDRWSFITVKGNTPSWDANVHHEGYRSIRIQIQNTKNRNSGYPLSEIIEVLSLSEYNFSAWVKTLGTGGTNAPAVRLVELDANKKWLRETPIKFEKGTNPWTMRSVTITTSLNTRYVYVYSGIVSGYGTFWLDDVELSQKNVATPTPTPTPLPAPSSLVISSGDGLTLKFNDQGKINSISINENEISSLPVIGGLSFREVLMDAPNLVANPGFEEGSALNWSFISVNGNTPSTDSISHSGTRSIKISIPDTIDNMSGYVQSDMIAANPLSYYTFSAWGRTEGSEGTNAPGVTVVELDADKKVLRQADLIFADGINDWSRKQITFQSGLDARYLYVYAGIWKGYGTFWIDDVQISPLFGPSIPLNGTLIQNSDGTLIQKARSNDIDFTLYYISKGNYIEIQGVVQDKTGVGRELQVMYSLPVDLTGWNWIDKNTNRIIYNNMNYERRSSPGEYSTASASNEKYGLSLEVSPGISDTYSTIYNNITGYSVDFRTNDRPDINSNNSTFKLAIFKNDGGFSKAEEKYYEIYPALYNSNENLIFVYGVTNISKISSMLENPYLLEESARRTWLLKVPVVVKERGSLHIGRSDVDELRMLSKNDHTAFLKVLGKVEFDGVRVLSWNETAQGPAGNNDKYRGYIFAEGILSELKIFNSTIGYLGLKDKELYYQMPEKRGLVYLNVIRGEISSSTFEGIGEISVRGWPWSASNVIFSNITVESPLLNGISFDGNVSNSKIIDSTIMNSTLNGVDLNIYNNNEQPSNINISGSKIINAGKEGITFLNSLSYSSFEDNYIEGTHFEGFDIEGGGGNKVNNLYFKNNSATGAYYDGYFIQDAENITIENGRSYGNGWGYGHGMTVWDSKNISVSNSSFFSNYKAGIVISRGGSDYLFKNNTITNNGQDVGFEIYNSSKGNVILENNTIDQKYSYVFGSYSNPKTGIDWINNIVIQKDAAAGDLIKFYTYNASITIFEYNDSDNSGYIKYINGSIDEEFI